MSSKVNAASMQVTSPDDVRTVVLSVALGAKR